MASEVHVLDPTAEDSANVQLTLTDPANGIDIISVDWGNPDRDQLFAASADTIGDPLVQSRFRNRKIKLVVRCYGSEATMRARVRELTKKVGKIAQYGGTYKRTLNDAAVITFDLLDADVTSLPADFYFLQRNSVMVTVEFLAAPYGRGASTTYSTSTETTNPELIFTVAAPAGDAPALGQVDITDLQGQDQWFVQYGLQCRNYPGTATASTTAALTYAGTSRLTYNGSTALAISGALSGNALNQGTLTTNYAAMMSLASTGTAYPTHIGNYNVWARCYAGTANAGSVSVALEWSTGDFRVYTRNADQTLDANWEGTWRHVPLGQVHLPKAIAGSQRWDGRIVAKSTIVGDDLAVDRIYLFPVDEGYGEASGVAVLQSPTTFSARDEFDQSSGALTGKTLPVGGTWSGAGDADDWQVSGTGLISRNPSGADTSGTGRWVTASTPTLTLCAVQAALTVSSGNSAATGRSGIVARYVNTSNHLRADYVITNAAGGTITGNSIEVSKVVSGTRTVLATLNDLSLSGTVVCLVVDAGGRWWAYNSPSFSSTVLTLFASGQDSALATGGTLASGKVGLYGETNSATVPIVYADNFVAWVPATDAAMFANQSLRIQHNAAVRKDTTGTYWQPVSSFRGDYLRIPAGNVGGNAAAGSARMMIKACRNDPYTMADSGIDDIKADLTVTPLYLQVP